MNQEHANEMVQNMNLVNPTPDANAVSVTGIIKKSGKIAGYQLSDGQKVDKAQGVQMAKDNHIKHVAVASKKGSEYLRAMPDGEEGNNLANLPVITE